MIMKAVSHKCPNCSADLKYNPKVKNWKCEYCASVFSLDELKKNEEKFSNSEVKNNSLDVDEYHCQGCGARIVADHNTAATFCVYCKNTAILKGRLTDKFSPSKVIPFSKNKDDAIVAFKNLCKDKFLLPSEFSDSKNIKELTGIYIPFWLYSCNLDSHVKGTGKKIKSWISGDYRYEKIDLYGVERSGNFTFENIPIDGSVRFNDAIMNSIEPFDYSALQDFSPSYLAGFLAEKYDVESSEAKKYSIDRARQSSYSNLISKTYMYNSFVPIEKEANITNEDIKYVLLPVWMVNIKYNEKIYTFAMNGQTGKMIGDLPYSKGKAFLLWLAIFIICMIVIGLITWFI